LPLFQVIPVGGLQTNCYILTVAGSNDCAVIDPGGEPQRVIEVIKDAGLDLRYVLCTHGHADHTGGVAPIHAMLGGEFYLAKADVFYSVDPPDWLIGALGGFIAPPKPDDLLQEVTSLPLGGAKITLKRTPGHTPGSTCFLFEDMVFTGDTLFRGSIGRYDLPGGNGRQELESIRDHLLVLPDATKVFPGHGPSSTIGEERHINPYLAGF
jgi:hydroxyacylglutathione hydrolase